MGRAVLSAPLSLLCFTIWSKFPFISFFALSVVTNALRRETATQTESSVLVIKLTTVEQVNLTVPLEEDGTSSRCLLFVPVEWDIRDIRVYGFSDTTGCQDGISEVEEGTLKMADFGEILRDIGEFGLFQKLTLVALSFPNVILPFQLASIVFIESDPERHCNTDWILNAAPNLTTEEKLNLTVPRDEDGTFSRCLMFVPVDWDISDIRKFRLNETTGCQEGWVYGNMLYEATIVTDFDLVCGQASLLPVAQTVLMAGILVGCLLFGPFAESFGRKRATQIPIVIMVIVTVAAALSPNFYFYLASQFIVGIGYGGYRLNGVILATEWIGVTNRSWGVCVNQLCGALGQCILAGVVYFVRNWRLVELIITATFALVTIYIWFIPESARWLLSRGRTTEAKQLIRKAAAINKRTVPDSLLEKVIVKEPEKKSGIITLIQSAVLRKYFFTITLAWFSVNVTYFCLSFNVGKLGLDIFMTQAIFGLSEVPGHILCICLLEAVGRKASLMGTLLTAGLSCILMLAFLNGNAVAVTALATCGRFLTNWAGSICSLYAQELFPTSFRQTASGLGSIASRAGGLVSPLVNMLTMYHWSIPITVYSSLTIISGALAFLLPETRRKELPDSKVEAEGNRNKPMKNQSGSNIPTQGKSTKL